MIRVNKNIGARVEVYRVITAINPKDGWVELKKVPGVIVEDKGYEFYCHYCSGGHTNVTKELLTKDTYKTYAIQLDNGVTDIEGNNVIIVREYHLKFLDRIEVKPKPVSIKNYMMAKETIKRFEAENRLEPTVFKIQQNYEQRTKLK